MKPLSKELGAIILIQNLAIRKNDNTISVLVRKILTIVQLMYEGLKLKEILSLQKDSFMPSKKKHSLGKCGSIKVWGEETEPGRGKLCRIVIIKHNYTDARLDDYVRKVRPVLTKNNSGTRDMFVSSSGGKLTMAEFREEFNFLRQKLGMTLTMADIETSAAKQNYSYNANLRKFWDSELASACYNSDQNLTLP